jgi:hypothetical protein
MKLQRGFLLGLGVLLVSLAAGPAYAAPGETEQTQTTAHYKITLTFGGTATMLTAEQAAGAKEGEVMVAQPGMAMPAMPMTDGGQPINHHLEIAVVDKASGAVITDQLPVITLKNDTTGATRTLDPVMAMYDVQVGKADIHFGNNLYLPDGTYTITAVVNGETATFAPLTVGAGSPMSGGTMPATGMPAGALLNLLLAGGGLALAAGLFLRRARRVV